jgi:hypothetical protein
MPLREGVTFVSDTVKMVSTIVFELRRRGSYLVRVSSRLMWARDWRGELIDVPGLERESLGPMVAF